MALFEPNCAPDASRSHQINDFLPAAGMTQPDHLSDLRFDALPLHPTLLSSIAQLGFTHCTPIQAETLPRALRGEDLAGQAQTGTGKSAAFLLATLNHLMSKPRSWH